MNKKERRHINKSDRIEIDLLLKKGYKQIEIARILGFNRSSISKEINKRKNTNGIYEWKNAEHKAQVKRNNSKWCGMKIEKDKYIKDFIEQSLKNNQSPEGISGRLKKEHNINISHTSIYKWIYSNNAQRNVKYLCFRRYKKKQQNKNKNKREMISNLVSIDLRPQEGIHWEGDLFVSSSKLKHSVSGAMFVEINSQLLKSIRMDNRRPTTMIKTVNSFLNNFYVDDITFDRGIENRYHNKFKTNSYFCDPHSPWQKPHVENNIGLLRKWFLPKGTDLSKISQKQLDEYIDILNNKWRKSLDYKSPLEVARENGIIK